MRTFNPVKDRLPRYAHGKLDGHFTLVRRSSEGRWQALTTQYTDVSDKLEQYQWWHQLTSKMHPTEEVQLELCCADGSPAAKVKTALKHGLETYGWVFHSSYLPDDASLLQLEKRVTEHFQLDFAYWYETMHLQHGADGWSELRARILGHFSEKGYSEGVVLKDGNRLNWCKLKNEQTIDLIVKGTKDGKKRFIGLVGSLQCETAEGYHVCNCSGMDYGTRIRIDEDTVIGRVCEVKYDRVDTKGKLRFPRFIRWRDDKLPENCTVDQDPDLEEYWQQTGDTNGVGRSPQTRMES